MDYVFIIQYLISIEYFLFLFSWKLINYMDLILESFACWAIYFNVYKYY